MPAKPGLISSSAYPIRISHYEIRRDDNLFRFEWYIVLLMVKKYCRSLQNANSCIHAHSSEDGGRLIEGQIVRCTAVDLVPKIGKRTGKGKSKCRLLRE